MEVRARLERLIRRYLDEEIRNATDRFRYQGLVARYNVFNEMWNKRLRALEEGRLPGVPVRGPAGSSPAIVLQQQPEAPPSAQLREVRIGSTKDTGAVRTLYQRFVEERGRAGEAGTLTYQAFEQQVAKQTAKLRSNSEVKAVDYRVDTKGGKVTLKARAVK